MPHLVTLCTGNAARSVMAGAILAEHVPAIVVATRGTHVIEGMPMSWRTRDAIVAVGARAEGHRSRQLATADLTTADLVLAMAREHVEYVRRRHPAAAQARGAHRRGTPRRPPGRRGPRPRRTHRPRLNPSRTPGRRPPLGYRGPQRGPT